MHTISIQEKTEVKAVLHAERERAIQVYYNCQDQLDLAVNKGSTGLSTQNGSSEEITGLIRQISHLKRKIQEINSSLLVLETANYGVCVKTGKLIRPEWPIRLSTAN
jgi:RNA polymerase-binding transcription factor DksA